MAIIPARGGSKGVPRKNIRELCGKPLIAWTIEEAQKSKYIDRLILSSEDAEIITVAKEWGCEVPFVRPQELAQDETPGVAPVIHALETLPERYDYVVLLQPTSPLRLAKDIDECLELFRKKEDVICVSVTEPEESPYWMYKITEKNALKSLITDENKAVRRQDLPKVYVLNGAIYISKSSQLLKAKNFVFDGARAYIMPKERSIDIDDEWDLHLLHHMLKQY